MEVPTHLRNAPTSLMKQLGHGENYRYAHNEQNAYAAGESYLPREVEQKLNGRPAYEPVERGLEIKIKEKLDWLRKQDSGVD